MTQMPSAESACRHVGDLGRVAAWLFDCLDRWPPEPGGLLCLYLCYNPDDYSYFNSPSRDKDLAEGLLGVYRRELAWDGLGFGDLLFDLEAAVSPSHFALARRVGGRRGVALTSSPTPVEFLWHVAGAQTPPGSLVLVRRQVSPLADSARLAAALRINSGARIAPHADRWQRSARWFQPVVYLPEGYTTLTVGGQAGHDLFAPSLSSPLLISFDSAAGVWEWSALSPGSRRALRGRERGELELKLRGDDGQTEVSLSGSYLPVTVTLARQEEQNRLPSLALEITGCVLPRAPEEHGYGVVPEGLPAGLNAHVRTAVALPGNGGWLYFDEGTRRPYLLRRGAPPPGQPLEERGGEVSFGGDSGSPARSGRWRAPTGVLTQGFHGELVFTPTLAARLAYGQIAENVPDDLFPSYNDSAHGRAPVRLVSGDGRRYRLVFNTAAKHPVYVLDATHREGEVHGADPYKEVEIGPSAEFLLGTTLYKLHALDSAAAGTQRPPFTTQGIPAGGIL